VPSGWLGLLPLGLAQDPESKRRLGDDYEIKVTPSLAALAAVRARAAITETATITAVINPTGDLPGSEVEGDLVTAHFPETARTVLTREGATLAAVLPALKARSHWHFATHGTFTWANARQSALIMHDFARLSVDRLIEADGLGRPRLVVLSACETGLSEVTSNPDEFVGLPGAFLALGAAGVLGTLWPVNDVATALLISRFYELHIGENLPPATALQRAQTWLKQATNADLDAYVDGAAKGGRMTSRQASEVTGAVSPDGLKRGLNRDVVDWISPETTRSAQQPVGASPRAVARPFAHPYFWGGFVHTGH
jgi:CHAT domain-containing protein